MAIAIAPVILGSGTASLGVFDVGVSDFDEGIKKSPLMGRELAELLGNCVGA
jgi:hypothetical protein